MAGTGIIIQARMGSSRLPGKVLADLAGAPMLARQVERVRRIGGVGRVILATTDHSRDDGVATLAADLGLGVFRGSESDVLGRYAGAARIFDLDCVMRLTADCPLIDPTVAGLVLTRFHATPDCDYASNCRPRSFPHGFDCEVVSRRALDAADCEATDSFDREHVFPFIFSRPERFRCINVLADDPRHADLRLTVDYPEDLELARAVYGALYAAKPDFGFSDIIELLGRRPEIAAINRSRVI